MIVMDAILSLIFGLVVLYLLSALFRCFPRLFVFIVGLCLLAIPFVGWFFGGLVILAAFGGKEEK